MVRYITTTRYSCWKEEERPSCNASGSVEGAALFAASREEERRKGVGDVGSVDYATLTSPTLLRGEKK